MPQVQKNLTSVISAYARDMSIAAGSMAFPEVMFDALLGDGGAQAFRF